MVGIICIHLVRTCVSAGLATLCETMFNQCMLLLCIVVSIYAYIVIPWSSL